MTWPEKMKIRTKKFALDTVRFCRTLPHNIECDVYRRQLIKAGTSVGANYRATCRGRSTAEKKAKISIAVEEADECQYWLELLEELAIGDPVDDPPGIHRRGMLASFRGGISS